MAGKKSRKSPSIVTWAVLGLLVLAFGGFGVENFGGSVRTVGAVGDTEISVDEYFTALRGELNAAQQRGGLAPSLATPEGEALAQTALGRLIAGKALEHETARLGLSVGDEHVRDQILSIPAFQGMDGRFDREAYSYTLRQNRLSESQYEEDIRQGAAADLTSAAVLAALEPPAAFTDRMAAWLGERRDILWLRLDAGALPEPLPAPTAAELEAQYKANAAAYTAPELRRITYAALTPEMMAAEIEADEDELRRLYESRADEFNSPERRLVERLVFSDEAAAEAAKARIDAGEADFETLVTERGLRLVDIDLGDVSQAQLGAAGAEVFALDAPGIVGPLATDLGPALFRVNDVLEAQSTPFEEIRDQLAEEINADRARREIARLREDIDDRLAGGATLEDLAAETLMEIGTLDLAPDTAEGIAAYAAFREAAAAAAADDFPELIELEDGGLAALRLDEVVPPELRPLDEVRDQVAADWRAAETGTRLMALAEQIRTARSEGRSLLAQGYVATPHPDLARGDFLPGAPAGLLDAAFGLSPGEVVAVAGGEAVHLVEVTRITAEDPQAPQSADLRARIADGLARGLAQDTLDLFLAAIQTEAGIRISQTALDAVAAQFP